MEEPLIQLNFKLVDKFVRHFFHYRQKYCVKGVELLFPKDIQKKYAAEIMSKARVSPSVRCTYVSMEEIRDMCIIYEQLCRETPGLFYHDYTKKHVTIAEYAESGLRYPPEYPFKIENFEHL